MSVFLDNVLRVMAFLFLLWLSYHVFLIIKEYLLLLKQRKKHKQKK